jgi:hypothetical protein
MEAREKPKSRETRKKGKKKIKRQKIEVGQRNTKHTPKKKKNEFKNSKMKKYIFLAKESFKRFFFLPKLI